MPNTPEWEWKAGQAEFQGYVKARLEENTEAHRAIFDKLDSAEARLRVAEEAVTILKVKSGLIGGISAGIVLMGQWIWEAIKK
jgi:hypothetical protein